MKHPRRRRRRHAQLHLPPLDGAQAWLLDALCERLRAALWRAHGNEIAEHGAKLLPDDPRPRTLADLPADAQDPHCDDPF
jgi:hypothetical protein